jgi:hypothetical protein
VHIDFQGSSTCTSHPFLIPPPLIVVEKILRFDLNKPARLICSAQTQFKRKSVEGKSIVAHVYNHELFM